MIEKAENLVHRLDQTKSQSNRASIEFFLKYYLKSKEKQFVR